MDQVLYSAFLGKRAGYFGDKFSVPNFSDDLVPVMSTLLESNLTGIVHLSNDAAPESWFSYAGKILATARCLGLLNDDLYEIDQSKLDDIGIFRQERPRYTAMKPRRLAEELNLSIRNWELGLREYLSQKPEIPLTDKSS